MSDASAALKPTAANAATFDLDGARALIEQRLRAVTAPRDASTRVIEEAVRHALLAPGKRLRPLVTLAAAAHFGGGVERALNFACAVEMVHTASLVLDDLPCMDDAALRRGRPTVHVMFSEAMAVLAQVGLLNGAYGLVVADAALPANLRCGLAQALTDAVGLDGLVAGQTLDLQADDDQRTPGGLVRINHLKTAVLFRAAVEGGAAIAGASARERAGAVGYAESLGLAFQLRDDILDATGTADVLGKDVGQDAGKATLVRALGLDDARRALREAHDTALAALGPAGAEGPLVTLAALAIGEARP